MPYLSGVHAHTRTGCVAAALRNHRFLRSVCLFHSLSEDEIMYPEVRRLTAANPSLACMQLQHTFSVSTCEKVSVQMHLQTCRMSKQLLSNPTGAA